MLLLRTRSLPPPARAFAERLAAESGQSVCILVDERHGPVEVAGFDKIGLTRPACERLGLYCTEDFAWRCGDYGLYLARARYPEERYFWLVEDDVRITGSIARFFELYRRADAVDLIAALYQEAPNHWHWTITMASGRRPVWQCFFPVVRLSAAAIDLGLAERRRLARSFSRRAEWANDESFIATTVQRGGLRSADLNGFGVQVYDESNYSFDRLVSGDALDPDADEIRLLHPVLYGDDLAQKARRLAARQTPKTRTEKFRRKLIKLVNLAQR